MIDETLLSVLVCPTDHSPLHVADRATVDRVNREIAAGRARNRAGRLLERPIDGALLRADRALLYPILDGIPVLLPAEALPLADLDESR